MAQNKNSNKKTKNKKNSQNRKFLHLKVRNKELLINFSMMFFSLLIVFFTLNNANFYGIYNYQPGNTIQEDIYLQNDIVDIAATDALKQQKAAEVEPIMYVDFSKQVESKKSLNEFFTRLSEIKSDYSEDIELMKKIYAGIERKNIYNITSEELMTLITLNNEKLSLLQNYATDITVENMSSGLTEIEKIEAVSTIQNYIEAQSDISDFDKGILLKLISGVLVENKFVDQVKTTQKIDTELAKIEDVVYKSGTLFLAKGTILSDANYNLLKSGGVIVESTWDSVTMKLGLILMLVMLWGILHMYLSFFEKDIMASPKKYGILISLFLTFFLSAGFFYDISPYLIPLPAFSILASIMITPTIAIYFGIGLLILISMQTGLSAYTLIAYLLTILITRALVKNIKQRSQVVGIGLYVSLVLVVFTLTQGIINKTEISNLPLSILFAASNGVLSAILSIGIMPFFESFFDVLTPFKLLELSNPNRPLLKRLLIEAPGTYHHSILVGNLAETAAHDVGANSLLTRVSSFYHDVGKLERPYYYKENQVGHENPHDKLPPQVSANFIKNHMSYGVDLLQKNKLPKEIIDVVKAHHGTSLIKYFYHREQLNNPEVDIARFLYSGPKPDSKESVILMLADSVEAAVRSLEEPTQESITNLIDKIIAQKISENQFSNANLTFRELEIIKNSFLNVLSGIFHERIAYPEINMNQISKNAFDQTEQKEK
ncbi:HDIG domain-containing protein [Fusibacter bizertensis]|uniref:HDIG domain-containing protein n=1 Tax=Fusibacter bizertensis TaxID=1488331 RepID=A0ABT6NDB7_9FIRM|nr:HDIG domain-containing metalloprotein [Fusibacter bizertensis]MDH8678408.1 HDIG domain-containing protein [Fusibacter bizertensis]